MRALTLCGYLLTISTAAAALVEVEPGFEYNLVLDDGEELKKIKILSADEKIALVDVDGLAEHLKVPRTAIRSATKLIKPKFFRAYEVGLFGDFQLTLMDLRLLAPFFPFAGLSFTAHLTNKAPLIAFDAMSAEISHAQITDGERRIAATGFTLAPRWHFKAINWDGFLGAGGGLNRFDLLSYNFARVSYTGLAFLEGGIYKTLADKIRLYALIRVNYWSDSKATLLSTGLRLGASYVW